MRCFKNDQSVCWSDRKSNFFSKELHGTNKRTNIIPIQKVTYVWISFKYQPHLKTIKNISLKEKLSHSYRVCKTIQDGTKFRLGQKGATDRWPVIFVNFFVEIVEMFQGMHRGRLSDCSEVRAQVRSFFDAIHLS